MSNKWVTLGWRFCSSSREEVRTWKSSCASLEGKKQVLIKHCNIYFICTILKAPTSHSLWELTCSSNELMCQRYNLRTSRRHPASRTSSSVGSSLDRAVRVQTMWRNRNKHSRFFKLGLTRLTGQVYTPFRSWSSVVDSWLSLQDWTGRPENFSNQLIKDGHAAKPWSKEFKKQVLPRFRRPGTIPVKKHNHYKITVIHTYTPSWLGCCAAQVISGDT